MGDRNRKRIGILFNFNGSWLGGAYYIANIVKSLNYLSDEEKPELVVLYRSEHRDFVKEFKYPHLDLKEYNYYNIYFGYLISWMWRKNVFVSEILENLNLDGVYPLFDYPLRLNHSCNRKLVAWFPDLQHKFYPKYFSAINLFLREKRLRLILKNSNLLVVSSNNVANHFKQFYEIPRSLNIKVLQFVSVIETVDFDNFNLLKVKYKIPDNYFIVSNQFYEHKNHEVVIEAIGEIVKNKKNICIVFTGKFDDYRNPEFIKRLKIKIEHYGVENNIRILGVIPRADQLCLIKHSISVVQPSFFEGWSTVIEDAKSLNIPVICSDIDVHREQLGEQGIYFNPKDINELALILTSFPSRRKFVDYGDLEQRIILFSKQFITLFD